MKKIYITLLIAISVALVSSGLSAQTPLGEEFSYQGELKDTNGNPHDGVFDFKFVAFDAKDDGMGNNLGQFVAEDVTVNNGIFTTQIDYSILGDQPFVGNKIWLEISVRIGTTIGGFQQLLPRQPVTATPYANYATIAEMVGSNAVGTNEIIDDSIGATDIGINAVGTSEIDSTQVQRRVSTTCPAGQFMQAVNQDGTAVCVAETAGITSVTSAEIVDGTIVAIDIDKTQVQKRIGTVCSGGRLMRSIDVDGVATCIFPNTGADTVVSADIVDGTIVAADVDTSQIQQRIGGSCDDGQYLNGINQDGSVICKRLPFTSLSFIADNTDSSGSTSIAIGSDGFAIVSYYHPTLDEIRVFKCNDSPCNSGIISIIASSVLNASHTISIRNNGLPIVSYLSSLNTLHVFRCDDISCSTGTNKILDNSASLFANTSIVIGNDSYPIISYFSGLGLSKTLKTYKCIDVNCDTGNINNLATFTTSGVSSSDIVIAADNYPIIVYIQEPNDGMRSYKCTNEECSSGSQIDLVGSDRDYSDVVIGSDGIPIVSFYSGAGINLKFQKCNNTVCNNGVITTSIDGDGLSSSGKHSSISIGLDGMPIISYQSKSTDLNVFKCNDINCTSGSAYTLDNQNTVRSTDIAIDSTGLPIISYIDETNNKLRIYSCGNHDCR